MWSPGLKLLRASPCFVPDLLPTGLVTGTTPESTCSVFLPLWETEWCPATNPRGTNSQREEGQRCRWWSQATLAYPEGGTTSPVLELSDLCRWHCRHCSLTWLHPSGDSSQTAGQNPGHAPSCPFTPLVQSISPRSLSEIWIYVWIYVVRGDERRGLWSWLLGSESTIMIIRIISLWGEADLFAQIAWVQISSCPLSSHEGFKVTWKNVTWVRSMLPALCPSLDSLIGVLMCISPSPTRKAPVLGMFYTFSRTGAACSCWLLTPRQVSLAAHISAEALSLQCHRVIWWHRPPGPIHLAKPVFGLRLSSPATFSYFNS